jgi:hypothetical protein
MVTMLEVTLSNSTCNLQLLFHRFKSATKVQEKWRPITTLTHWLYATCFGLYTKPSWGKKVLDKSWVKYLIYFTTFMFASRHQLTHHWKYIFFFVYRQPGPPHCWSFEITFRNTTLGRTSLEEWSARRSTQHLQEKDIHAPGRIRTRNPSNPRLRKRDDRDPYRKCMMSRKC